MVEIVKINDRESLWDWLEALPRDTKAEQAKARQFCVWLAHRSALRAFPKLGLEFTSKKGDLTPLPFLWCLSISGFVSTTPNPEMADAAANAAKSFLRNLPEVADVVISDTVVRGGADEMAFRALHSEVLSWLDERADENPKYADSWLAVSRFVSESHALNMDYTQSASKLISIVQRAAQKIEAA